MDYRHVCAATMVAHHGLKTAHDALISGSSSRDLHLVLMRSLMMDIANLADIASISGDLHRDNQSLGDIYKNIRLNFEFFKYIRNKYIGHYVPELTSKTFEWIPYSNAIIGINDKGLEWVMSIFSLETVINTYSDSDNNHKIFKSETDLLYQPDYNRFMEYLYETAILALDYASLLMKLARRNLNLPNYEESMFDLARVAAETKFSYISKGKR